MVTTDNETEMFLCVCVSKGQEGASDAEPDLQEMWSSSSLATQLFIPLCLFSSCLFSSSLLFSDYVFPRD